MIRVTAEIHLDPQAEGGLAKDGFSGMQPSINIDGELVACKIIFGEIGTLMPLGRDYCVMLEIPYGEFHVEKLKPGFQFDINIASRKIGSGSVISLLSN